MSATGAAPFLDLLSYQFANSGNVTKQIILDGHTRELILTYVRVSFLFFLLAHKVAADFFTVFSYVVYLLR